MRHPKEYPGCTPGIDPGEMAQKLSNAQVYLIQCGLNLAHMKNSKKMRNVNSIIDNNEQCLHMLMSVCTMYHIIFCMVGFF